MDDREWTTIDKSKWPRGEWDDEPDKVQWTDKETGMPCLAVRHRWSGHWCGYVGVTAGHPAFEKNYSEVDAEVHGGLTFSDKCSPEKNEGQGICHVVKDGEDDNVWWLGFDCNHSCDVAPTCDRRYRFSFGGEYYRPLGYVKSECRNLASQLAASKEPTNV